MSMSDFNAGYNYGVKHSAILYDHLPFDELLALAEAHAVTYMQTGLMDSLGRAAYLRELAYERIEK